MKTVDPCGHCSTLRITALTHLEPSCSILQLRFPLFATKILSQPAMMCHMWYPASLTRVIPAYPALEVQSLSHWTPRGVAKLLLMELDGSLQHQ